MTPIQRKTLTQIHEGKSYNKMHAKTLQNMGLVDFKRGIAHCTEAGREKAEEIAKLYS